jgi:hypothetical protein
LVSFWQNLLMYHSPFGHELLVNLWIKCQKKCFIRSFGWISLRHYRLPILLDIFLIKKHFTDNVSIWQKVTDQVDSFAYFFLMYDYVNRPCVSPAFSTFFE